MRSSLSQMSWMKVQGYKIGKDVILFYMESYDMMR